MADMNHHLMHALHQVFEHLNKEGVKEGVDKKGLEPFIKECAVLAATTGAASGFGGVFTIATVPADLLNNVLQQFRVTLAVIYDRKGRYNLSFEEFMAIVALSLGIEVGVAVGATFLTQIAAAILVRLTPSVMGRLIPGFGAVIGGTVNYMFIKGIGQGVKAVVR